MEHRVYTSAASVELKLHKGKNCFPTNYEKATITSLTKTV